MLKIHQNCITSNLEVLVDETDLTRLVPELITRNVFNELMITRILNSSPNIKHQKTVLYLEILKRGPQAFAKLRAALAASNHSKLADILNRMDPQPSSPQLHQGPSLDFAGLNENPGPSAKTCTGCSQWPWLKMSTTDDIPSSVFIAQGSRVSSLPAYQKEYMDKYHQSLRTTPAHEFPNYEEERNRPVRVKRAERWQSETIGKPQLYKMDSNPRGYALVINNKKFYDEEEFPERRGSDNDVKRAERMLKQLHYIVEVFVNQTKAQMERIVENFSRKPELYDVDSVILFFMSHGEEGTTEEDTQIMGVDGLGYKTEKIISHFYNDTCKAMIGKPKMFFFQACRGNLTDSGVRVGKIFWNHRTGTDGRRSVPSKEFIVRTFADIFVAFPTAPGRQANRDFITGTWFIQAIVDVFTEFACVSHLEDLIKMVDDKLRNKINLPDPNFQSVTIKTIGWNKNLYFNPGLCRDQTTKKSIRIEDSFSDSDEAEDMDVVDMTNSKTPTSHDDDNEGTGCFNCCFRLG